MSPIMEYMKSNRTAAPFAASKTILKRLKALQSSHSYVVYSYYQGAGFGNFVNGLLTMYAVAICKGAAFRGALPYLLSLCSGG